MNLKNQGVLEVVGEQTALKFISKPVATNSYEGKKPYQGEAVVQPYQVLSLWHTFGGKKEKFVARSGKLYLVVKYFSDKRGVRVLFTTADQQSSYFLSGLRLIKFMDDLLREIKNIQTLSLMIGDTSIVKIGDNVILRQGGYEYYLKKEDSEKVKKFIEKNFILREPIPYKAGVFGVDKERNFVYRDKIKIPIEHVKDIYNLIL